MAKKKQQRKIIDLLKEEELIEVPWEVRRFLQLDISIYNDQMILTEYGDSGSLREVRVAVDWLVDQLDGKVTWL